jgi:hypothetical protein
MRSCYVLRIVHGDGSIAETAGGCVAGTKMIFASGATARRFDAAQPTSGQ